MTDSTPSKQQLLNRQFFHQTDAELLERLRQDLSRGEQRAALNEALGIDDPRLVDELLAQDINAETLAALRLVPLVVVAWSDASVQEEERQQILAAAEAHKLSKDSPAYALLREWLYRQPPPELLAAWKDYVGALSQSLSPEAIKTLRDEVLGEAEQVARAAGGILGFGSVDRQESATLADLRSAFPQ